MNKGKSYQGTVKEKVIEEAEQTEQEKSESKEENLNQIMGIINKNYIVKTSKGLKRVNIKKEDKKKIGDYIVIENL